MKYLKLYESNYNILDYVIVYEETVNPLRDRIVNSAIGQLIKPDKDVVEQWSNTFDYYVKFENIPEISGFYDGIRPFNEAEIVFSNPDKEVVEAYLLAKKYNL